VTTLQLRERIDRLDKLARGLAREALVIGKGNDPLLYAERQAYLAAVFDAIRGLEAARVALARAAQRMGREKR